MASKIPRSASFGCCRVGYSGFLPIALFLLTAVAAAFGQSVPADGSVKAEEAGQNASRAAGYKARLDLAVGGSFVDVRGSREKYRSDINIRQGVQVSGFRLDLRPVEGGQRWFDAATVTGQGLGGVEPFEAVKVDFRRNGRFEFQFNYSKDNYYFNVPGFALDLHADNSLRRRLDFSLTYYLRNDLKLRFGYGNWRRSGNTFTSGDTFNDVFRLLLFNRSRTDDYRIGAEWQLPSAVIAFDQNFRNYRFDDQLRNAAPNEAGLAPQPGVVLGSFRRDLPMHGLIPSSQVMVKARPHESFELLARYRYSKGSVDSTRSDLQTLQISAAGLALEELALTQATSDQPMHSADLNLSWSFLPRFSIHNSSNLYRYDIRSDALTTTIFRGIGELTDTRRDDSFTRYRRAVNETTLEFEANRAVTADFGYRYGDRLVIFRSASDAINSRTTTTNGSVFAALNAATGTRWKAAVEFEHGWANNALIRIEPLNFNRARIRGSASPVTGLKISGSIGLRFDENDAPDTRLEFNNKEYSIQASWVPRGDWVLELGYSRTDILSAADILFFLNSVRQQSQSRYVTNANFFHALTVVPLHSRLRAEFAYRLIDDTGGSYPLVLHQGEAGLSFKLVNAVWLDAGWRYYGYNEKNLSLRDYVGNIVSLGIRFSF